MTEQDRRRIPMSLLVGIAKVLGATVLLSGLGMGLTHLGFTTIGRPLTVTAALVWTAFGHVLLFSTRLLSRMFGIGPLDKVRLGPLRAACLAPSAFLWEASWWCGQWSHLEDAIISSAILSTAAWGSQLMLTEPASDGHTRCHPRDAAVLEKAVSIGGIYAFVVEFLPGDTISSIPILSSPLFGWTIDQPLVVTTSVGWLAMNGAMLSLVIYQFSKYRHRWSLGMTAALLAFAPVYRALLMARLDAGL